MIRVTDSTEHQWAESRLMGLPNFYVAGCSCGWYTAGPDPKSVHTSLLDHMSFTL